MDLYEGEEIAEAADVDDADGTEVSIDADATRSDADESYHNGSEDEELPEGLRARVEAHAGQWATAAIALTAHLRKLNDHLHHLDVRGVPLGLAHARLLPPQDGEDVDGPQAGLGVEHDPNLRVQVQP